MKIIIVGGGKVGTAIAAQLTREGHDLTLIDSDRRAAARLESLLDIMVMCGNGATVDIQRSAGVDESDLLIAVTEQDELNLLCCVTARKLGCQNTIARVRNPDYFSQMHFLKDELALSLVVNPELDAAREIFQLMKIPGFLKRDSFAKGRAEIVEIELKESSGLDGVRLAELQKRFKARVLICAVDRDDQVYIPDGSFVLRLRDKVYITAQTADLPKLIDSMGIKRHKTKNVMLVGGGRISRYLGMMLLRAGTAVKIIEIDQRRAELLAELLPGATVINADGSSQQVLLAESVDRMDSVATLTDIDEENLIISMYANYLNVPQVITKINRTEYSDMFETKGIDCIVSPKQLSAQKVIRYVRSMQSTSGEAMLTMHYLVDGQIEAVEFEVNPNSPHLGVTLTELKLRKNILIACINRAGRIIIPGGMDKLLKGDTVVVVSKSEGVIVNFEDIFEKEI